MSNAKPNKTYSGFDVRWYKQLVDVSPFGVVITDAKGNCLHVNRRWQEIVGMSDKQVLGKSWLQAIHDDDNEPVTQRWQEAVRQQQSFFAEYRLCKPHGQFIWVACDANPVFTPGGKLEGYVGSVTDISDVKRRLIELEKSVEGIQTVISQMPVILFAFDKKGRLCAWNSEAERVSGYSAAEMINSPNALAILCPDANYRYQMLDALKERGSEFQDWEWQLTAKDGTVKTIALSNITKIHPMKNWASWGVGVDMTERRRTEYNLRERVKEITCLYKLSQISNRPNLDISVFLQEVVGLIPPSWQFPDKTCARIVFESEAFATDPFKTSVARLSSDLRVRGRIVGLIEVYYMGGKAEAGSDPFLPEERLLIDEMALQVSRTIGHVLSRQDLALMEELSARAQELEQFSHVISHDLRTPLTAIGGYAEFLHKQINQNNIVQAKSCAQQITDISERMEKRLEEILKLAKLGKIVRPAEAVNLNDIIRETLVMLAPRIEKKDIKVSLSDNLPFVIGDQTRLCEVVENLLDNAIKYIGDKPNRLEIGCRTERNIPVFYIKDNGIGIDQKHFDSIFDLFWRINKNAEGDGTGLAIVKRIIEAHGGRIWVESDGLGKGCCFCFTLGRILDR
ncbi:MAG: PAS domain S-box protein [Deltaproteobacteria bacterium]|jgi:PAS domain S-box-containing protein|nr:PAS domain S-box protein [Deltaproteobacteria bacterium]